MSSIAPDAASPLPAFWSLSKLEISAQLSRSLPSQLASTCNTMGTVMLSPGSSVAPVMVTTGLPASQE